MTEQSDIPDPTPADDIIPHQERVEFIIDNKIKDIVFPDAPEEVPARFANPTGDVEGLVGVLPKVATNRYAGLVTLDHAITSDDIDDVIGVDVGDHWYLLEKDTPATADGYENGTYASIGDPAGVYLAFYDGSTAPTSFPEGWTPGNTTGEGPVVPLIGGTTYRYYSGLVKIAEATTSPAFSAGSGWYVRKSAFDLTFATLDNDASDAITQSGDPIVAGVHQAVYFAAASSPAPPVLPDGWTFQPYGLGKLSPVLAELVADLPSSAPTQLAKLDIQNGGNPDNPVMPVWSYHVDGDSVQAFGIVKLDAGGTVNLRRVDNADLNPHAKSLSSNYRELQVASLDGTEHIHAYGSSSTIDTTSHVLPLTTNYARVGTDLTLSGNVITTTAGGIFVISATVHVVIIP